MITVVIPYFQRQSGVLRKALASVAAQQACQLPVHVIVVDDASPVPPAEEIAGVNWPAGMQVRVLPRPNGGPGAARNSGLDAAPAETSFVAFLDSDDEWEPTHLARGVAALEAGFDFYFADHLQLGQQVGAFSRAGRIALDAHPAIAAPLKGLHRYIGDLFDQILTGNIVGTSTVMYRMEGFSKHRFRVEFTTAGEDYLFWMGLARTGARVAFSSEIEATYGRGVNVYAGSGWGTERHLLRVHQEIAYRLAVRKLFELTPSQRDHIASKLGQLRQAMLRDLLHRLRRGQSIERQLISRHLKIDPGFLIALPGQIFSILLKR